MRKQLLMAVAGGAAMMAGAVFFAAQGVAQTEAKAKAVTVHVAAASDLQTVMPLLAVGFERETGIHVEVSYGSSSALATQIVNGAPMDVFFSADYSYAERVVAANLTDTPAPVVYAKGTVVLWERKDGPFQPLTLDALSSAGLKSVALANPLTAPYGLAATQALHRMQLYDKVAPHFVVAENVGQAAQFAASGNAQVALISLTLAMSPQMRESGSYVVLPVTSYTQMQQCAVVMRSSAQHEAGRRFLEYVLSGPIQAQLAHYGLTSKDN